MFKKTGIKKLLKELFIYAVIIFLAMNIMSYLRSPTLEDSSLQKITSTLIDGSKYSTLKQSKKPLLVHFWATWCPTCKLEADNIQRISKKFDVITIAVKSGSDSDIQKYLDENNFNFKVINDKDAKLSSKFLVPAFPTTFIYNSKKELIFSEVGYSSFLGLYARMLWAD
jgi:thiol-disulfide isomerase/thioredoxin